LQSANCALNLEQSFPAANFAWIGFVNIESVNH